MVLGADRRAALSFIPAVAILVAMIIFGIRRTSDPARDKDYFADVSAAISDIPYRIGGWIGADMEAQAPAIQLLRPNKLLQRRYAKLDGAHSFSILFVHCSDARDMEGHYPPVCYPAHGWIMVDSTPSDFILGSARVPCTIYRMKTVRNGDERRMTILNFFAFSSTVAGLAADMTAVSQVSSSAAISSRGAAQFQLILQDGASLDEVTQLMQEIGPAVEPAVWSVVRGARSFDE